MSVKFLIFSLLVLGTQTLSAVDLINVPTQVPSTDKSHLNPEQAPPPSPEMIREINKKALLESSKAAEEWFNLVDAGKYKESWDKMALTTKVLMKNNEWETYLKAVRKPFGKSIRRTLIDQRVATDPPNVPKGDYIVIFYDSSFSNKVKAQELIILQQESNGSWHVFSYMVK